MRTKTAKYPYGTVQETVSIMKNGELEKIEINKSSGYNELDEAVFAIKIWKYI